MAGAGPKSILIVSGALAWRGCAAASPDAKPVKAPHESNATRKAMINDSNADAAAKRTLGLQKRRAACHENATWGKGASLLGRRGGADA